MASKAKSKHGLKDWTVMVYLAGDNDLSVECVWSLKEMYRAGLPTDKVALTVQLDTISRKVQRFDVGDDLQSIAEKKKLHKRDDASALLFACDATDGELEQRGREIVKSRSARRSRQLRIAQSRSGDSMASPKTLTEFIRDSIKKHPAHNYMLILAGHGSGAIGKTFLVDDFPPQAFTMAGLSAAIRKALEKTESRIAILGMDSCGMAMAEVGYELRESVDYLVAAEGFELDTGWPYHKLLEALTENHEIKPRELAAKIVSDYSAYYSDFALAGVSTDIAACDLKKSKEVAEAIAGLASTLSAGLVAGKGARQSKYLEDQRGANRALGDAIILAHWRAQSYRFEQYTDLWDFCDLLEGSSNDAKIRNACRRVKEAIEGENLIDGKGGGYVVKACQTGEAFQHSHGVSIYFPWAKYRETDYNKLAFSRVKAKDGKTWGGFIKDYVEKTRRRPRGEPCADCSLSDKGKSRISSKQGKRESSILDSRESSILDSRDSPILDSRDSSILDSRDSSILDSRESSILDSRGKFILPEVKNPPDHCHKAKC